jgi:methoxymalonate biosynthesis acyl carrier protein
VTTGDDEAIREAIRDWVHQSVGASYPLTDQTDLIGDGVLTSLQTVELVTYLDERFGVEISDDEFVEENFRSIDTIAQLVESKRA